MIHMITAPRDALMYTLDRYQESGEIMADTAIAKLFMHGRSQAVRLPKEFRLPGDRVRVRAGDLSADVAELGGETVKDSSVGHLLALLGTVHGGDDLVLLSHGVRRVRFGQLGEEVGGGDADTGDSDRKIDVLYVCVRMLDVISEATRKKPR